MIKSENSYLVYLINTSTPCLLELRILYCNSDITEYLHKKLLFVDVDNHVCINNDYTKKKFSLEAVRKGAMGTTQLENDDFLFIEGLAKSINRPSTITIREEDKFECRTRLVRGLANLVIGVASEVEGFKYPPIPHLYTEFKFL